MGQGVNLRDASLKQTVALPSAANGNVNAATGLDMEVTAASDFVALTEVFVSAPALNTTQLPNAATMTYNLIASASANMASPTTLQASVLVQTGAGGTGAAAATDRVRLPTNLGSVGRYLALQAVGLNNGNCQAASATLELLF